MALSLYFVPSKFPRTITRDEWKSIWRWKRVTEQALAKQMEEQRLNFSAFGNTHPHIRAKMIDQFINPPLLVHDRQDMSFDPKDVY